MSEAIKFLQDNPLHYVATTGLDGRPSVRPFQSIYVKDGRIYYGTGNFKAVYKELQKNPAVQINA
ncbi:MAG: pyridoxamine 5'-phosphate oxidase family protein, partial [Candidatus Margulisbacteria bacterium]|nr:pyridoxamine 5'-phosphate oxidase family protein [Candidatus Margulisiibacteriota bacterium]